MARAGSHPGRRRGPLSGVDLPPERWPQSAARDPLRNSRSSAMAHCQDAGPQPDGGLLGYTRRQRLPYCDQNPSKPTSANAVNVNAVATSTACTAQ